MPRTAIGAAFIFIVSVLPGCMGGATLVHQDAGGGVVSIPENTNVWPTYYRDAAYAKIREVYPGFTPRDIVDRDEVVVGQQTRNDQRVDRRQIGPDGKPIGELVRNTNTTTTTDLKEFRITYRVNQSAMNARGPNSLQNVGGAPVGLQQAGGIPKTGTGGSAFGPNDGLSPRTGMNGLPPLDAVPNSGNATFGTR